MALLALLRFAVGFRADESVSGVVFGMMFLQRYSFFIFFGCIFVVALYEFEFLFAFEALADVAHFSDGFVLELIEFFVSH